MSKTRSKAVKGVQIEFTRDGVVVEEDSPEVDSLKLEIEDVSNLENKDVNDTDCIKPNIYVSEIPLPIEKKTGIMRQVLSGMEKMFIMLRSAFRRVISWFANRAGSSDGEKV